MLQFKTLTIKNFMSIGNITQTINLDTQDLSLILGENLDLGGDDSRNGTGKAQPLHSKIKTPDGWTTMGEIAVGDAISTPCGGVAKVTHTFPQGKKDVYQFTFSDGRTAEACGDHLWKVFSHSFVYKSKDKYQILTTKELIEHRKKYKDHKSKSTHYTYVPLIVDQNTEDMELLLDPYFLGAMLGDGCFSKHGYGFTTADLEIAERVRKSTPEYLIFKKGSCEYSYGFKHVKQPKFSLFTKDLKKLGLHDTLSHTKFIPADYKNSSTSQKIKLLQGLVDTDGHVGGGGCLSICTVSKQMATDIQEMVWSIGGIANISIKTNCGYKKDDVFIKCKDAYNVSIMYHTPKALATLQRKVDSLPGEDYQYKNRKLRIEEIEYIGDLEAKCIMIDHPDHLYITDNYIITHNSSILNALSYALYDNALTKIRKDNLVNKTNAKDMYVTLNFDKDGTQYTIERGRKSNKLKFLINNHELVADDTDEAQGDSRVTQRAIEQVIGLTHTMFKNIVALNTYSEPFLAMRANDQRDIIEQLLGITKLSEKAEVLKVLFKNTKDDISEEEYAIKAINNANGTIEKNIQSLEIKSKAWARTNDTNVNNTETALTELGLINIDDEIVAHGVTSVIAETTQKFKEYGKEIAGYNREIALYRKAIAVHESHAESAHENNCPTCGTDMDKDKHREVEDKILADLAIANEKVAEQEIKLNDVRVKQDAIEIPVCEHTLFYSTLDEAYSHRSSIESLTSHLSTLKDACNPYIDQIETLRTEGLQVVDYETMHNLVSLRDHQDFLLKLLLNKDSFIRKRIIDQNLSYLNSRLEHYLSKTGLPHEVSFLSDLSVEITEHGRGLDFDNLSRGERTRLILSLSWAFRDVYESLNDRVNLLFIDELMDNGLDASGVEGALGVLKHIVREKNRSIFLISHREELLGRVDNIVKVVKSGGFTSIEDYEE